MKTNEQPIEYVKDTFEEYLGKKTHISASDIKNFLHSPRYYYFKAFEEQRSKDVNEGRHFSVGSALHEIILEPHLFKSNYLVAPKVDRRTKAGKEEFELFMAEAQGKTILFPDEMEMVCKMAEETLKNDTFIELIKDSYREVSCYTTDEKTGIPVRLRPDSLAKSKSTITDIKSCLDSSYRKFKNDVYAYEYSITASYYMDFLNRENYVFCAIEKEAPYQASLYVLDDEKIEYGRSQYRMALDLLRWSRENNYWCDYTEFAMLKECYELQSLEDFFETKKTSEKIIILK
jgi:exodeoxyribonuclease VIII